MNEEEFMNELKRNNVILIDELNMLYISRHKVKQSFKSLKAVIEPFTNTKIDRLKVIRLIEMEEKELRLEEK
jgi:hypothetical protein